MRVSDEKLRADRLVYYAADVERLDSELDGFLELSGAKSAMPRPLVSTALATAYWPQSRA